MKIALVGPEIEENLALRYIHASLARAGHQPALFGFNAPIQIGAIAAEIAQWRPDVVGLSMLFTSRSHEFVALARELRACGFRGHLTAGGHFAAFHAPELLTDHPAFDSIVHGEGEEAMVELVANLGDLSVVRGLTFRGADGAVIHTGRRPNSTDLDARSWPSRPATFHAYLGRPIANVLAGRGCYADCSFCSINAWHRQNGGKRFRMREVGCVAREIAWLNRDRGVQIFNFQDDNFFLPTEAGNLQRLTALEDALRREGIGRIGLQAKARPDSITRPVVQKLVDLGVFRLFLGVETDVVNGLRTLGRGIQREQNHEALAILREFGIHTCFNLLMFDPDSDIAGLRDNVAFMAKQDVFPLNFCRVEVYAGTALEERLRAEGRLKGDYMGYTYDIADPAAQLAYTLFWKVFGPRNFGQGGLHHESMRVDYNLHVLEHFHPERVPLGLKRRVKAQTSRLNQDSARLMGRILDFAERGPRTAAEIEAEAAALSRDRSGVDRELGRGFAALIAEIHDLADPPKALPRTARPLSRAAALALVAGAWVGLARDAYAGSDAPPTPQDEPAPPPPDDPYTHMCEAAPPPHDLLAPFAFPTTVGVDQVRDALLAVPKVERLHDKYPTYAVTATVTMDHAGTTAHVAIDCAPPDAKFAAKLAKLLTGVSVGAPFADATLAIPLWQPVAQPPDDPYTHMCEAAPAPFDLVFPTRRRE